MGGLKLDSSLLVSYRAGGEGRRDGGKEGWREGGWEGEREGEWEREGEGGVN